MPVTDPPHEVFDTPPAGAPEPRASVPTTHAPVRSRPTSPETLRRRALLDRLHVPMDGPTRLATRVDGVPAAVARRAAAFGTVLLVGYLFTVLGVFARASADRSGALVAVGVVLLIPPLFVVPLDLERRGGSARHGKRYHYLSVSTRTGIRTIDLARLVRVEQRAGGRFRVLDADGVSARITSAYGRAAVRSGVERWGLGQVSLTGAARRCLLRTHLRTLIRHPLRSRRRRSGRFLP